MSQFQDIYFKSMQPNNSSGDLLAEDIQQVGDLLAEDIQQEVREIPTDDVLQNKPSDVIGAIKAHMHNKLKMYIGKRIERALTMRPDINDKYIYNRSKYNWNLDLNKSGDGSYRFKIRFKQQHEDDREATVVNGKLSIHISVTEDNTFVVDFSVEFDEASKENISRVHRAKEGGTLQELGDGVLHWIAKAIGEAITWHNKSSRRDDGVEGISFD
jgi:hypothetical protein